MAVFNSFTFDGINSLDSGVYITGQAVFNAPERVVEMVTVPGRNGALALDQGRFENIEVTYHAGCFADSQADFADKVMRFRNALASRYTYKRLTDEYHPDEYRLGLYKSGLDVDAVRYGTAGEFNIVFDCKPQRFLIDGDRAISPTEWSDVQTESGELVTIDSDGSLAVKSLEVSLEPIQDLNGYDKPWVGGAGKNKLPNTATSGTVANVTYTVNSDGTIIANGTSNSWSALTIGTGTLPSGTYWLTSGIISSDNYLEFVLNGSNVDTNSLSRRQFTLTQSTEITVKLYARPNKTATNLKLYPMIYLDSETDTTYAPYSNICPISGRTEVVTQRTGKNLLNPLYRTYSLQSNVRYYRNGGGGLKLLKGVTYTLSVDESNTRPNDLYMNVYDPTSSTHPSLAHKYNAYSVSFTPTEDVVIETDCYYATAPTEGIENIKVQLEVSATATEYEPYKGTTYTTALGRTVYGGTLDVTSGVLTVDRAMTTLDGTEAWYLGNGGMRAYCSSSIFANAKPNSGNNSLVGLLSNQFVEKTPNQTWDGGVANIGISLDANKQFCVCLTGQKNMTVDGTKAYFANNPLQVVYPLATPQTYQLTPQQIELLVGENHVWSDGEITVEYGVRPYYNPTPFASKPLIKVTGTGTLGIGEYVLTITGTASQTLYIDCETMEIYTLEGTVPMGASSLVSINKNDFPVLEPGTNNISVGSGITAVTITPRWWRI